MESKRSSLIIQEDRVEKLEAKISELQRKLLGEVSMKVALEDAAPRRREVRGAFVVKIRVLEQVSGA